MDRLYKWETKARGATAICLISLSMLPTEREAEDSSYWDELSSFLINTEARHDMHIYHLSYNDYMLTLSMSETNQVGLITDIKFGIIKLVQKYFPEMFGAVDQSRLIRLLKMPVARQAAIKLLETWITPRPEPARAASGPAKKLVLDDILRINEVRMNSGIEAFAKAFIKKQKQITMRHNDKFDITGEELYISMESLRLVIFPHVELRGSGNIFNQLTVELDKIILSSFNIINPINTSKSINLNVESIFTEEFESFTKNNSADVLSNTTFEFKQSDILQHYDEFIIAIKIIEKINSKIAIDAVLPETLGLVNFSRIKPKLIKIFWRAGSEDYILDNKDTIDELTGHNIDIVLARIDDEKALNLAKSAGIMNFQGFLIDKMINGKG